MSEVKPGSAISPRTIAAAGLKKPAMAPAAKFLGFLVWYREQKITLQIGEGPVKREVELVLDLQNPMEIQLPHGSLRVEREGTELFLVRARRKTGEHVTIQIPLALSPTRQVSWHWGEVVDSAYPASLQDALLGDHLVDFTCSEYMRRGKIGLVQAPTGPAPTKSARRRYWMLAVALLCAAFAALALFQ